MNSHMAWWIIDGLIQQGVQHICIAPGSRSTPLVLAAAHHKKAKVHIHYDERGLGFYALGLAFETGAPSAIIVTSGTALGNLLPSVMEAYHSHVPLILLTADRPFELIDTGANQTCDQIHLFGHFVRNHIHLPTADEHVKEFYIRSSIAQAVCEALYIPGPVHINWHIREPLFVPPFPDLPEGKKIQIIHSHLMPLEKTKLEGKGVIVLGKLPHATDLNPILKLAKTLSWPILADVLSNIRSQKTPEEQIRHIDWIFKKGRLEAETIVHFGKRLTSKAYLSWSPNARRIHVSPWPELQDPSRLAKERVIASIESFCGSIIASPAPATWLSSWKKEDEKMLEKTKALLEEKSLCTELHAFYHLSKQIDPHTCLYLGNGMPIRDADLFFFPKTWHGKVFSNRGLSGIDGNIATAAGLSQTIQRPLIAWIGDQAALHDLNSLPLLKKSPYPLLLIISNNFGGGIFSHLPLFKTTPHFETYFANAHSWNFEKAAEQFNLPYDRVDSIEEFLIKISPKEINSSCVIELVTSRELNFEFHRKLQQIAMYKEQEALQKREVKEPAPQGF